MRDKLSALKVQTTKHVGRYADGGGLYLFIRASECTSPGRHRTLIWPLSAMELDQARAIIKATQEEQPELFKATPGRSRRPHAGGFHAGD
jgi:hypothetical protein